MTDSTAAQTVFTGPQTFVPEAPQGRVFRHIIIFRMYDGTTQATVDEALRMMVAMCEDPTVLHYEVSLSDDRRKGLRLLEFVDFQDEATFTAFKATQGHLEFANFIRSHADWDIADYTV